MIKEYFPDGTPISEWFYQTDFKPLEALGKQYLITDYGAKDDGKVYTAEIQAAIDCAAIHGGVVVVPKGTYISGSLFLKQGVHFYVEKDGTLLGSDDISDYRLCDTRIEGESCKYYAALLNAENINGTTIGGEGTIDGNGLKSWKAFWLRWKWKPEATNKDEQRPRLLFLSHCTNMTVCNLRLQNSCFWTCHIYKCHHTRFLNCSIYSPYEPVPAPSTDAIDIDACADVLVKNCTMHANDDAIALKGGKGPWADTLPENGSNERILIEDCRYDFCHCCLTCGSESIHNRNILVRRIHAVKTYGVLHMKMRPDTPQLYEYITVEDSTGNADYFIGIKPWTQFFDLKGREDIPLSIASHIRMQNCNFTCDRYWNIEASEQYRLTDFTFENLNITAPETGTEPDFIDNLVSNNVIIHNPNDL